MTSRTIENSTLLNLPMTTNLFLQLKKTTMTANSFIGWSIKQSGVESGVIIRW